MKARNRDVERPVVYAEPRRRGSRVNSFLAGAATVLLLLLGVGGYLLYRAVQMGLVENPLTLLQVNREGSAGDRETDAPQGSAVNPANATPAPQATVTLTPEATPAPPTSAAIQPGEFVQQAFGNKAQVELLSLQRVPDPLTGNRDVVNVQVRIRRLADDLGDATSLNIGNTTARNPQTTETFKPVDPAAHSTGTISLSNIRNNASVDAYVWLRVPVGVKTLNIYVPQTGAFNNVPISD